MMNPAALMKIMSAKNTFEQNHPKFANFIATMVTKNFIDEGSTIEITVTKADGTSVTGNMRVTQSDMELLQQMKSLGN